MSQYPPNWQQPPQSPQPNTGYPSNPQWPPQPNSSNPSDPQWPPQQPPSQPNTGYPFNPQWQPQSPSQPLPPQQYTQYPPQQQGYGQEQWHQPPPMQPGMYPPQQPPKKKSKTWLWIVLGVVAVLLIGCIGTVIAATNAAKNTVNNAVATVNTLATQPGNSNTPAPSTQHFATGQVVKVGDAWQVTVNSAKTSNGDQFTAPKAGNIYVIVDVTLKNLSGQAQNISSALNFSLQDATGQKYTETILSGETPPDGSVAAGALLRGQLTYEVPTTQHALTFNFEPDITTGDQTIWDIHV